MEIMASEQQIILGNRPNDSHSFPDNWQLCSLGEITTSSQYGISSSLGGNYSLPILKMNNLQDGHIDFRDLDYIQLSKAEMESLMLNKGDLLINRTNSLDLVGKAAIYDLEGEHVFASYLVRFRLGPSVLPTFVNYFLNSEPGQRKLKLLATKAVSQANINPSILKRRLFIPIPPILEQHRIVEILCALDDSINLTTQLIAKKRDIKQATMQQLLTGKMRLPGFSGEWEVKKLGEVGKPYGGLSGKSKEDFVNGQNPYIPFLNIMNNPVIDINYFDYVNIDPGESQNKAIKGDLFFNGSSETPEEVGMCSVLNEDIPNLYLNSFCFGFRLNKELKTNGLYLSYYFRSNVGRQLFYSLAQGATRYNLSKSNFLKLEISYPEPDEQTAIATVFSDMDAEIVALEQRRDKTCALKQGMMQELLTGKTRLL